MAYNPYPFQARYAVPGVPFQPGVQGFMALANVPGMVNVRQNSVFYNQNDPGIGSGGHGGEGMMSYSQGAPGMMLYSQATPGLLHPTQASPGVMNYSVPEIVDDGTGSFFSGGVYSNFSSQSSGMYFLPPQKAEIGSVPLGVPTEVVHTEGNPLSMQLQLCNEPVIKDIQRQLSIVSQGPDFHSIYALSGAPKVCLFYSVLKI
jgi:hypothetical protein